MAGKIFAPDEPMEHILLIEDSQVAQAQLRDMLGGCYRLTVEAEGLSGLTAALAEPVDLILLDINLPDVDGYEVCRMLKEHEETRGIPVIFLTSLDTGREKVRGFEAGADDYVVKPFYPGELLARINLHLASRREKRMAVELERLKLLREMAIALSHELNNPMTTIFGLLHLAGKEVAAHATASAYLSQIRDELEKIRQIVGRFATASQAARTEYLLGEEMIDLRQL